MLAAACSFLSLKFPFFSGSRIDSASPATISYLTGAVYIPILLLTILLFLTALVAVFMYKQRKLQLRITIAGIIVSILTLVLYFMQTRKFASGTFSLTALLAVAVPIFFILAARGIYKDEKLVRSLDRLR